MTEISAKVIGRSKSVITSQEIITFELVYPRYIHGELLTHRLFSRNAASSRAIPINKMIAQVQDDPATPIHWGKNQPGMQASVELTGSDLGTVVVQWESAARCASNIAEVMLECDAHKQIVNRILEPFQWMKTVLTATEFDNFYWLRNHEAAQPEIKRLAEVMLEAVENSSCVELQPGEWHTPYFGEGYWLKDSETPLQDALDISASCCAQVSYRTLDDTLEKAQRVVERLNLGVDMEQPCHASPTEHQATPMPSRFKPCTVASLAATWEWPVGITHVDRDGAYWSGNLKGFVQYRQLVHGNVYKNKEEK